MKIEDAIKRYESWAEDDRIDILIRKEHKQMADWLKELKTDRPQGEWIFKPTFPNDKSEFPMGSLVCSVCGSHHSNSTPCNYCPNCGARMKGADDE